MTIYDKPCQALVGMALAFITSFASSHPLEDAAERATALCFQFEDVESLEYCGTEMTGRSPERAAARIAMRRLFEARTVFMRECQATKPLGFCTDLAEWYMGSGIARLNAPVQYTDALPRSDARR